ncbi:DUF1990 family protein [Fulvivirgaceae bacterium BMA10]|uniref:DUF1990 family protein n=1 Tax=Splendidivirga corallicola TaxID=3051826 RepID=A0ABT8KRM0_9BACT|nr:DUF1990 family protein [Fulvivirgaceae bacterium BMA10]
MKIFLIDQKHKLPEHLDRLKSVSIMSYEQAKLKEQVSTIELAQNFKKVNRKILFDYRIFPQRIMTFLTQWRYENREIRQGDTIVQQVYIPPLIDFSQKIIFGVRIKEVIDETNRFGFSYETLEGHVERGISTFTMEQGGDRTIFKIHTFSTPGNILTKLIGPVFSRPYQSYCTKAALRNFRTNVESE